MKYSPIRSPRRREPLATLPELADRVGASWQTIAGLLSGHPEGRPYPAFPDNRTGTTVYYHPSEFMRWYRNLPKESTSARH